MPNPISARQSFAFFLAGCLALLVTTNLPVFGQTEDHPSPQQRRGAGGPRGVYKSTITPHWWAENKKFWYLNQLRGETKEFILVDAEKGVRSAAFDHARLAAALSKASKKTFSAEKLPFSSIEFLDNGKLVKFEAADKTWKCDLSTYDCTEAGKTARLTPENESPSNQQASAREEAADLVDQSAPGDSDQGPPAPQDQPANQSGGRRGRNGRFGGGGDSPDGKWVASIKENNVHLRPVDKEQDEALTTDGAKDEAYGRLSWSPDSKFIVAWKTRPGDQKKVFLIRSSPSGGGRAVETSRAYSQAGDKFTTYELAVIDAESHKLVYPEVARFEHEYEVPSVHWTRDHSHFVYQQEDRGHQRMRLIEVAASTGAVRNLVDEQTTTFIWTAHTEGPARYGFRIFTYLDSSDEVLHLSEKDGWRHIYLVDPATATAKQVTKGNWVVRGINRIDESKRQIYFCASGMYADQDPYFTHYYRINFDGTELVTLTAGNGNHSVENSPDNQWLIDTYSRVDMAPVHDLRSGTDGQLICRLEEADISELKESGWTPPEVFVAKGRDGKTDIWGIITKPTEVKAGSNYPILENIYNGPQDSYVPKSFSGNLGRAAGWGALGFYVVQSDAMGTANRSKAFHDVCWHNLGDAGFPDRIAWIKAAAAAHPEMDINRVGIFGTSAGGQNAAGAVLFHPEFYKAAVANCGCHDNRIDKASWNEQWMGYLPPDKIWTKEEDNWYSKSSNIDNAGKLGSKLFLIVGELDTNVPPESTLRLVDALIKAGKDFEFLVIPGADHGANSGITQRRTQDFFIHALQGKEPPDRNAAKSAP